MSIIASRGAGWALLTLSLVAAPMSPPLGQDKVAGTNDPDIVRITRLRDGARQNALRKLLIGSQSDTHKIRDSILRHESLLRPALRSLVADSRVGQDAAYLLALIGVPEDLRFIIQSPPPSTGKPLNHRWAYGVACSLLDPNTEEEWRFLRKCVLNEYEDRWVDLGAIQTLKLIASPHSRKILEEAQGRNRFRAVSLARALAYIDSKPAPLNGPDLDELAARVGAAIKFGDWEGTSGPNYSEGNDKAFVDYYSQTGEDRLTYTATFHKIREVWKLRGFRETLQEFAVRGLTLTPRRFELPQPPELLPPKSVPAPTVPPLIQPDERR